LEAIFKAERLRKLFPVRKGGLFKSKTLHIHAVDDVSFNIHKGETFGIVGESGCGKTTLGRLVLRLTEPSGGKIYFKGQDITELDQREMKRFRRQMQMIFQDPFSSLNPRKNILYLISEPLKLHKVCNDRQSMVEKVREALGLVDLPQTEEFMGKMPDEISGGERQRVGIARALIVGAEFIVADEPVSMLDASVKAGITSLMMGLKNKIELTYIFITHELAVAHYLCDRIAVMYLGKIVELGSAEAVIKHPLHPYTKLLMDALPPLYPDGDWANTILERGELPFFIEPPPGCRFHPRCVEAEEKCKHEKEELTEVQNGHFVTCYKH
jgi:oligopeptide/dipeptide ABC transporter ATP-binding protein